MLDLDIESAHTANPLGGGQDQQVSIDGGLEEIWWIHVGGDKSLPAASIPNLKKKQGFSRGMTRPA